MANREIWLPGRAYKDAFGITNGNFQQRDIPDRDIVDIICPQNPNGTGNVLKHWELSQVVDVCGNLIIKRLQERQQENDVDKMVKFETLRKMRRENDVAEGLLTRSDDVVEAYATALEPIKEMLMGLPIRLLERYPETDKDLVKFLQDAISEGLNDLASYDFSALGLNETDS